MTFLMILRKVFNASVYKGLSAFDEIIKKPVCRWAAPHSERSSMPDEGTNNRLWRLPFVTLMIVNLINFIGFGIVMPQIPGFAISLGATIAVAGVVAGLFPIFALIGRPFASLLGDRLDKKYLLIVSLALTGVFTMLYAVTPTLLWVVPVRVIHGLLFSISGTVAIAYGAGYIPRPRMSEGIGFLGLGNVIGLALGPNIGIYLVGNFSFQLAFFISGLVITAAGLFVFTLRDGAATKKANPEEPPPVPEPKKKLFRLNELIAFELLPSVAFVSMFLIGTSLVNNFLVLTGGERGIANVGIYFLVNASVIVLVRSTTGKIIDRKGVAFAVLPAFVFMAVGMVIIAWASYLWMLLLAAIFMGIGSGISLPAIQADCIKRLDASRRAVASGTYFIGLDVGVAIGPVIGGFIAGAFGFHVTFMSAGIFILSGVILYPLFNRMPKKELSNE